MVKTKNAGKSTGKKQRVGGTGTGTGIRAGRHNDAVECREY